MPKGTRGLGRKVRQKTQDIVPKGFNGLRITHACAPAVRSISGKVLSKWVTRARRGERNLEAGGCGRPGDPLFMLYHSPHVLNSLATWICFQSPSKDVERVDYVWKPGK